MAPAKPKSAITVVMLDELKLEEGLKLACNILQVKSFYPDQLEALKQFFRGKSLHYSMCDLKCQDDTKIKSKKCCYFSHSLR